MAIDTITYESTQRVTEFLLSNGALLYFTGDETGLSFLNYTRIYYVACTSMYL